MNYSLNTDVVSEQLNNHLKDKKYFESSEPREVLNARIYKDWNGKFEDAISKDLSDNFPNLTIEFQNSKFDLEEESSQGSPVSFFFSIALQDKTVSEYLKINIRILISYNRNTVYLDSDYSNLETYLGKSKTLKKIFKQLKTADEKPGYFLPISLKKLLD